MKPIGIPRDAISPNGFFLEAIVNSATGSRHQQITPPGESTSGYRCFSALCPSRILMFTCIVYILAQQGGAFAGSPWELPPRAPTDPYVRNSRIRLVKSGLSLPDGIPSGRLARVAAESAGAPR